MKPTEFAPAPFASGDPMVRFVDVWTGGLHDGNASGGPCVRFGAAHALYAGTIDARSGLAPTGRGCVADANSAATSIVRADAASASGTRVRAFRTILHSSQWLGCSCLSPAALEHFGGDSGVLPDLAAFLNVESVKKGGDRTEGRIPALATRSRCTIRRRSGPARSLYRTGFGRSLTPSLFADPSHPTVTLIAR